MGWLKDLAGMFFPRVCRVCGRALVEGEELLCLRCCEEMPRTNLHLRPDADLPSRLLTAGKAERLAAMFYYRRGNPYAMLIQDAKYHSSSYIDRELARMFARELMGAGFFSDVDVVIPVPMYFLKRAKRGFNQAEAIAEGISEVTSIPVGDNLIAARSHATQTRRSAESRRNLGGDIYEVRHAGELEHLHVLLVDDVLTTGGTLLACCKVLHAAVPTVRVSLLTLACSASSM